MGLFGDDPPDPAKSYVAGLNADLETFPERRIIDAASALGKKVTLNIPGRGPTNFDFTGLGQADVQAGYGDAMLSQLLQLQRDLGPEFVEQRLAELREADPEGAAMRERLWGAIKSSVEAGPTDRPDLKQLEDEIMAELGRAGQLTPETSHAISQRVMGNQVARGNYLGNAAATEEATVMAEAGEQQRAQAQQQAMAFLTGGISPDDAQYREGQQNLANLGSFIAGETPTAQFGQLSGAQRGAAPAAGVSPGLGLDPNAGASGINWANNLWSAKQGQVNPWTAGLVGAAAGANLGGSIWNSGG